MSIKVMTLVWDVKFPGLAPKMVALKLADCASDRGDSIFPAVETIERTTGCVRSTVCKWLFAMEHSGLLKVVKRSAGGAHNDTTRRAFDMDVLRRLVPIYDADGNEIAPELKLVEVRRKRLADDENGAPVVVPLDDARKGATVSVFEIVPNDDAPPAGGAQPPPGQSDQGDGSQAGAESGPEADPYGHSGQGGDQGSTPPPDGGVGDHTRPSNGRVDEGTRPFDGRVDAETRPPGGLHPSVERTPPVRQADPNRQEPSRTVTSPPPPRKRGARERKVDQLLEELRAKRPEAKRAIDVLIDPLIRARYFRAPDPVFVLARIADWAEHHADEVLVDVRERLQAERGEVVKPADIETALEAAIERYRMTAHQRPAPADLLAIADPEIAAKGAQVVELIKARLGPDVFATWFSGLTFERVEGGHVVASVGARFLKTYIEQHYAEALDHCASRIFGHGTHVKLVERRALSPARAAATPTLPARGPSEVQHDEEDRESQRRQESDHPSSRSSARCVSERRGRHLPRDDRGARVRLLRRCGRGAG